MNESPSPTGFVAPEPSELAPLFPGYEIHDLIATGGMGAVYRAVQKSLDRTVALKILPLEFSEDAEFCAGFEAEAKAMARLNHPNLIGVHDFGEVNKMLFIVMEFVRGKSLYHSANGRTIEPREVARLVTGICNGLAHAHENGILHRDIKPSNILLTPQAEPKIGDFGLARPVETKTQAGEVIFGTPGYTAPEVVDAPETVDHRADLFSVGVLLHELLTGKLPADDPRPASVIAGCDARFDAIIRRATNPVPAIRYSSAAEIAAELQTITSARATSPIAKAPAVAKGGARRPPRPVRTASAGAKRKSMNLTWIGPLLAVAIMAFSWYTFLNMKPRVVVIDDPAAKPSAAESSEGEVDPFASSAATQTARPSLQPPAQPSVSTSSEHQRPVGIPEDAGYSNGKWYKVYNEKCSWNVALGKCEKLRGRLVTIPDMSTNQFVIKLAGGTEIWLGANDRLKEGQWIWTDGAAMTFRHFDNAQPDNSDRNKKPENCLMMRKNGFWNDVNGTYSFMAYVCEWPDKSVDVSSQAASSLPASTLATITSDFENDADGWSGTNIHKQPENISLLRGGATTGSKGYLSLSQNKGDGRNSYFAAPAKFLGDKRSAYHGLLRFQLKQSATTKTANSYRFVLLKSATQELYFKLSGAPSSIAWSLFELPIHESSEWIDTLTSAQVTKEKLLQVLGSLDNLWILAEYSANKYDQVDLDDVALVAGRSQSNMSSYNALPTAPPAPAPGGVLPQPARGAGFGMGFRPTLDVVGTWQFSDTVQLEIRPDGTIFSDAKPAGKWTRRDKVTEYLIVFNNRSEHIATLDKYKRILRTASRERGVGKSMERIDDGPTKNPNVPDRTTALKMECSDLETEIKSMEARLEDPRTDKSQAGNLEWNIKKCRQSLVELKSKIGMN